MNKVNRLLKKPSQVLRRAMGYIEKGWVQGVAAEAKTGQAVLPWNKKAVCWCMYGAVQRALHDRCPSAPFADSTSAKVDDYLEYSTPDFNNYLAWNDEKGRRKASVLKVFKKAIALAEKDEANVGA